MARQRYVYSSRQGKHKKLLFWVVSLITIAVIYAIVRHIFAGGGGDELEREAAAVEKPVVKTAPSGVVEEPKRTVNLPSEQPPRAVVSPGQGANAGKEQLPAGVMVEDVGGEMVREPIAPAEPIKPVVPVKSEEDILGEEIQKATQIARAGKVIEARDMFLSLLRRNPDSPQSLKIKTLLSSLSEQWLFGEKVYEGDGFSSVYTVKRGDFLSRIGNGYNVPWEFLLSINKISRPEALREGQKIKVVEGPFNAVITRSTFTMDLYLDDIYIKSYKIGLGTMQHQTPTGLWLVGNDKLVSPSWTDPDSGRVYDASDRDYPLGKRWIGLRGIAGDAVGRTGFALHGTNEPQSIGQRGSRGCVRLADADILEVYDLLAPGKSQVQIVD